MFGEYIIVQKLLASILVGYLLGSIPFAHVAARLRGVDIFATGSKLAGTANVFWNIGHRTGAVVLVGDVAKGALAVTIGSLLDVHGPLLILAGGAAVIGHWKSIFTRFRGGHSMATLMGITITLVPVLALLGVTVGVAGVLILWRSPFRSDWGIVACFTLMLGLSRYYQIDLDLVSGLAVLAAFVLFNSVSSRRRRLRLQKPLEVGLDVEVDAEPDLSPATPENR